jgi:MoaA/NifB/PqqE/SkfB family radical SAM enzyme
MLDRRRGQGGHRSKGCTNGSFAGLHRVPVGNDMKYSALIPAWGSVLIGRTPFLSVEITRECPLECPGCYAYQPQHLGAAGPLIQLHDYRGTALVEGVLELVRRFRPLHLSIVGGEPLVRYRELDVLLPKVADMDVEVQVVTSAVRPIPAAWKNLRNLHLAVSVDGLRTEHDQRRAPATYDRILEHILGHRINVHCTITRQQLQRSDYLGEFAAFWSALEEVGRIWFSLYTPQEGERSDERLTPEDRKFALAELARLRTCYAKIEMPDRVLDGYLHPPLSPRECIFAQTTTCISADLTTRITPCQFGGRPVCTECGCIASAGLASFARYKLAGLVPISSVFSVSRKIGERVGVGA